MRWLLLMLFLSNRFNNFVRFHTLSWLQDSLYFYFLLFNMAFDCFSYILLKIYRFHVNWVSYM
jgi:hypothetical protein